MVFPFATVRRVMPGQISIVGFSRFIFRILRGRASRANVRFRSVNALPPFQLRLGPMKKSQDKQTTAENLEEKFDRSEDVLDYFEVPKARVISPRSKGSVVKTKFAYPAKRNSDRRAAVREKSARYRSKK